MNFLSLMTQGLNLHDLGIALLRVAVGTFFCISGCNKLFNKERHANLTNNLKKNGIPFLPFMQWWVPFWEFAAGGMLAVGLVSAFSAVVLIIVCIVACCCEAKKKVEAYHPINTADRVDDYLYLPEVLYLILLMGIVLSGACTYSLDHWLFGN